MPITLAPMAAVEIKSTVVYHVRQIGAKLIKFKLE